MRTFENRAVELTPKPNLSVRRFSNKHLDSVLSMLFSLTYTYEYDFGC